MAVVMTTKFYEEDTPAWHDLSKVVFTSPNIDSPNTAGKRSHILPGQGDLALWYEDSSNMYEIEPEQVTYDTSLYYYHFDVASDINLGSSPMSAVITSGNYPQFINFIKNALDVEVLEFDGLNSDITDETLKLEYTVKIVDPHSLEMIYYTFVSKTTIYYSFIIGGTPMYPGSHTAFSPASYSYIKTGWQVEVISDLTECYIDFEFLEPTNITYIVMEARSDRTEILAREGVDASDTTIWYFIGNFKIQGKTDTIGASWVDLYTGFNTTNTTKDIFMSNNTVYYTYYRILILNNDTLTSPAEGEGHSWDTDYYAISGLTFYGYEYSTDPGTGHVTLYSFDDDTNSRELHVVNATPVAGSAIDTEYDTDTNVEGTINVSAFEDGEVLTTRYIIDVDEVGSSTVDYHTQAFGDSVSPVISGTTGVNGTIGITSSLQDFGALTNGYMNVTGETKIENGYIYSSLSGQQTGATYSNPEYNIVTDITYTTTLLGTIASGTVGDVAVTGCTNRYEDRSSYPRSAFYHVSLTNTVGTGIITEGTSLYLWDFKMDLVGVEFSTHDSIVFEITEGEAYDCRLTAWDDVTHSTTLNYLISGNYVRVSALAFRAEGTVLAPKISSSPDNYIASPIYNRIFKGNVVYEGTNYYYGDFGLSKRTEPNMIGDYLIFKLMLYGVNDTIPYGVHDHLIVLHYSYT